METTLVKSIFKESKKYIGQEIKVEGWVRTVRDSKVIGFIELNDGTFFKNLQIVFEEALANFEDIVKLPVGSAIIVRGLLAESPGKQPFELKASTIEIEGLSTPDYPLQKKRHSFEYLRTIAHLRPRTNTFAAVFRVRSIAAHAINEFFQQRGFVYVHTPIITGSDAEGAGAMFRVSTLDPKRPPLTEDGEIDYSQDFFGKETNLTVSGQLEGEAYALAYRNIYTFGPTFRAENSNTPRHAAEFWMMEPEMAFCDLSQMMDNAEDMVKFVIKYVMEHAPEEIEFFNRFIDKGLKKRLENVVNSEFARITYTKAIDILQESDAEFEFPVQWGMDLQTEHERYLTEKIYEKPVFVTDYPKDIKAFYMRLNDDEKTVAATDLLAPGVGELIGGSQREERLAVLERRVKEMDLDMDDYEWYLELRRFGGARHSGYGLGFARMVRYLTGMANIRDVIPFPRTPGNADY